MIVVAAAANASAVAPGVCTKPGTEVFPSQSSQSLLLVLDTCPQHACEYFLKGKRDSCVTARLIELTNHCVIKERAS